MTSSACPSLADLFSATQTPSVAAHAAVCPRCQALLSLREERFDQPREEASAWFALDRLQLSPGDVALVGATETDELLPAVVMRETDDAVTIVPLSDEIDKAAEWDLFLPRELLGYQVVAESWNRGRVLPEQIVEIIARLPEDLLAVLRDLLRASAGPTERPVGAKVGPAVLARSDPRLRFQDEETERVRVYWEQTLVLAGVASLGQLVATRREELGIEADELASLSLQRDWLPELEADLLDPLTLTRPVLVGLMRRLGVVASNRLGRIAYQTILARRGGEADAGLAFARKRQGTHPTVEDPETFVAAFLRDLAGGE